MTKELRIEELEKKLQAREKQIEKLNGKISHLENSEEHLSEEVFQYKELIYSSSSLICLLKGKEYVIEFANDSIKKIWGKGPDVTGKPLFQVIPEVRDQGIEEYLNQVYYDGQPYHGFSVPVAHNINGEMINSYFDISYMPQKDSTGSIIGVGVIAKDVTQQELLHEELSKNEEKYRALADFMPHKVSVTDKDGNSFYYNKSWLDYTGYTLEEIKEKKVRGLLHPEDESDVIKKGENSLLNGEAMDVECRFRDKNDEYKWHLCRAAPLKDPDGNITSWITSCTEIQKIKEEEERKEDFLKLVSHELKTPVTSIKGYIQLMQTIIKNKNKSSTALSPYLGHISKQVERLIRLISEILDLSRIEQNELELKKEDFKLNDLVNDVVEDISFSYEGAKIHVEHLDELKVNGDEDRIGQVLINFITNSLKYSEEEKKRIEIRIFKMNKKYAAIAVKDFGIGISEKDKKLIFNRFFRVAAKNDDTYSGFGIGLYLSKQIIERHHGEIFVNSELGKGSEFILTLPLLQN